MHLHNLGSNEFLSCLRPFTAGDKVCETGKMVACSVSEAVFDYTKAEIWEQIVDSRYEVFDLRTGKERKKSRKEAHFSIFPRSKKPRFDTSCVEKQTKSLFPKFEHFVLSELVLVSWSCGPFPSA